MPDFDAGAFPPDLVVFVGLDAALLTADAVCLEPALLLGAEAGLALPFPALEPIIHRKFL